MRNVIWIALVILLMSLAAPSWAESLEDGEAAWNRGDYATALRILRPLADHGVAAAQAILGIMYDNGQGVPRDDAAAVMLFRRAAEQGHAHAQYDLGLKYSQGRGVPRDNAAAVSWFRKAADQGDPEAMYRLGNAFEFGSGVPIDYVKAYAWYDRAIARFPASWTVSRGRAVSGRDALAKKMTAAQLEEAQEREREPPSR